MIETPRLVLRPHHVDDIERYIALWEAETPDPFGVPGFDLSPEDAWSRLLRFVGHRAAFGFAPLIVIERATDEMIGEVGYGYFRRGFGPDFDAVPEAMWKIAADRRGKGYAREAIEAATTALDRRGGSRAVCIIDPRNTPSMKIAQSLGFVKYAVQYYRLADRLLLARSKRTASDVSPAFDGRD